MKPPRVLDAHPDGIRIDKAGILVASMLPYCCQLKDPVGCVKSTCKFEGCQQDQLSQTLTHTTCQPNELQACSKNVNISRLGRAGQGRSSKGRAGKVRQAGQVRVEQGTPVVSKSKMIGL